MKLLLPGVVLKMEVLDKWFGGVDGERLRKSLEKIPWENSTSPFSGTGYTFTREVMKSGAFCYYGSLILAASYGRMDYHLSAALLSYATLYMLVDNYLDEPAPEEEKRGRRLEILFMDPSLGVNGDSFSSCLCREYLKVVAFSPGAESTLKRILDLEVLSVYFQKGDNHSRESYLRIAEEKGSLSLIALFGLIGIEDQCGASELGACIQILDDLYDCLTDIGEGIHTVATYDYERGGCDELLFYLLRKIDRLPPRLVLLKVGLFHFCLVVLATQKKIFSPSLLENIRRYLVLGDDLAFFLRLLGS